MPRQPFTDFLSSPAPSPRGRGRGGSRGGGGGGFSSPRGGGGGGRGGRGGYAAGGGNEGGRNLRKDYSAVQPIDYALINKEKYKTMDGFSPSPYNSSSSSTRGRGNSNNNSHRIPTTLHPHASQQSPQPHHNPNQPNFPSTITSTPADSGTATPVTGLGYHSIPTPIATAGPSHRGGRGGASGAAGGGSNRTPSGSGLGFSSHPSQSHPSASTQPNPALGRGTGALTTMLNNSPAAKGTIYKMGGNKVGVPGMKRRIVDLGAPVFVLSGTLFGEEDGGDQPDVVPAVAVRGIGAGGESVENAAQSSPVNPPTQSQPQSNTSSHPRSTPPLATSNSTLLSPDVEADMDIVDSSILAASDSSSAGVGGGAGGADDMGLSEAMEGVRIEMPVGAAAAMGDEVQVVELEKEEEVVVTGDGDVIMHEEETQTIAGVVQEETGQPEVMQIEQIESESTVVIRAVVGDGLESAETEPPLFYIDTTPSMVDDLPGRPEILFEPEEEEMGYVGSSSLAQSRSAVNGHGNTNGQGKGKGKGKAPVPSSSEDDEEEIVLVPRRFKQPEAISLPPEPAYARTPIPMQDVEMAIGPSKAQIAASAVGKGKGGKKAGGAGSRPVATSSIPSKYAQAEEEPSSDEGATTAKGAKAKGKSAKTRKQEKKAARKAKKDGRMKKTEGLERAPQPRMDSDIEWGSEGPPKRGDGMVDLSSDEEDAIPFDLGAGAGGSEAKKLLAGLSTVGLKGKKKEEMELLMDYLQNTVANEEEDSEEDEEAVKASEEMKAISSFAKGMTDRIHTTINDIQDARKLAQEDEEGDWVDSSGSGSSDEDEDEVTVPEAGPSKSAQANGKKQDWLVEVAPGLMAVPVEGYDEEMDVDEEDSDDDDESEEMHGMGWVADDSVDSDEDSDEDDFDDDLDQLFKGKKTWGQVTDDYIDSMDAILDQHEGLFETGNRKERNKIFRSIQNGDFGDDWPTAPVPKGKKNKLKGIPTQLQDQWEKDRQKKADKKRERELDRIAAEMSVFPAMKKQHKGKAKKHEHYHMDYSAPLSAKEMAKMFDLDTDEEEAECGRKGKRGLLLPPVTDLFSLNKQIQAFLRDLGKTTMTLPAMDKLSRKKIHEIAECYSLKSQSKGKGKDRFPILIKTSRSSIEFLDERKERKLHGILSAKSNGHFYKAKYTKTVEERFGGTAGRSGAGGKVLHKDGDAVGHGASAIGDDNIGHRLLSKMGWSEGAKIGKSGGLEVPIVAIIKNSKLGLGA